MRQQNNQIILKAVFGPECSSEPSMSLSPALIIFITCPDQVQVHHLASAPPSVLDETETLRQRVSTNELELMRSLRRSSEEDYEKLTESAKFKRSAKLARSAKIT